MTARSVGSGDMEVLATPAMVALMEQAAMTCVAAELDEGCTTVGTQLSVDHIRPTATGDTIVAWATVTEVDGRKITFSVTAHDSNGLIGEGTHVRYVVNRERFMSKLG